MVELCFGSVWNYFLLRTKIALNLNCPRIIGLSNSSDCCSSHSTQLFIITNVISKQNTFHTAGWFTDRSRYLMPPTCHTIFSLIFCTCWQLMEFADKLLKSEANRCSWVMIVSVYVNFQWHNLRNVMNAREIFSRLCHPQATRLQPWFSTHRH